VISGNPDERLAFVLETEAHLDGIRAARAEMAGVGGDADALGGRLAQFSAKSKAAFDSMTAAEQKAFMGFIGVKEGADQASKAIDQETASVQRATQATQSFINPAFAASRRQLAEENRNTAASFDPISSKARTAANAMANLSFAAAGITAGGPGTVVAIGSLTSSLAHLSTNAAIAAGASGIGALVVVAGTLIPLMSKLADQSERVAGGFGKAFGGAGGDVTGAERFLDLARQRRAAAETSFENAPSALSLRQSDVNERNNRKAALDEAVKDEQTAIDAVFAARRAARQRDREEAKRDAEQRAQDEIRARDLGEQMRGRAIQLGLERTSPELAGVTGVQMEQAARDREIDKLRISDEEKHARKAESERLAQAEITKIYDDAADKRIAKSDEEARKEEEFDKQKAAKRLAIAKSNVDAIVRTEGSVLQTLKRLALEPIVDRLEGIAAQQAVEALASWPDFPAMAAHGLAAAAATAAAREVAGWAGLGSKGGGGAGAGAGAPAGTFEPRTAGEGAGGFNLTIITANPLGPDHIQNVAYELNRAGILKRPIVQLPPTTGITVSTA
jgi:hypothetical protein